MLITIECIHRVTDSLGSIVDNTVWGTDNMMPDCNKVTCRVDSVSSGTRFRFPESSILLNDVMNFSNDMAIYQQYDCALEIVLFDQVELFTNHRYSIRGKYWRNVPVKYLHKYKLYKDQECIEINDDILLISSYNNQLAERTIDGSLIEIIPQSDYNLKSAYV